MATTAQKVRETMRARSVKVLRWTAGLLLVVGTCAATAGFVARKQIHRATVEVPVGYRTGAICSDGWHSFATDSGACSCHGGVGRWLYSESEQRTIRPTFFARHDYALVGSGAGRHAVPVSAKALSGATLALARTPILPYSRSGFLPAAVQ